MVDFSFFLFDLLLVYIFRQIFGWNYIFSVALAYIIATTLNYIVMRRIVFRESERKIARGYVYFLTISLSGILIVLGAVYLMFDLMGLNFWLSRFLASIVAGLWSYFLNYFLNFRIQEKI